MGGQLVGIDPATAETICKNLDHSIESIDTQKKAIKVQVDELATVNYVSATTAAARNRFDTESDPQLTKLLNTARSAVTGTREVIRVQMERQQSHAGAVNG